MLNEHKPSKGGYVSLMELDPQFSGHLLLQKTSYLVQICVTYANAAIVTGMGMRAVKLEA